jgi:hypothetical protein
LLHGLTLVEMVALVRRGSPTATVVGVVISSGVVIRVDYVGVAGGVCSQ